jgi:hypothetical protein
VPGSPAGHAVRGGVEDRRAGGEDGPATQPTVRPMQITHSGAERSFVPSTTKLAAQAGGLKPTPHREERLPVARNWLI